MSKTFVRIVNDTSKLLEDLKNPVPKVPNGKYYYTSADFKGQDYVVTPDITTGNFMVPLKDESGKKVGFLSWQSLAYPTQDTKWSVQESAVISLGLGNDANTYSGSSLSVATSGYYDMDEPYKFCLLADTDDKVYLTIRKITDTMREVVVSDKE